MIKPMIKPVLDGNDLLRWFYLGSQEVYSNKRYINSINVFPVADGDTGSNLSTTIKAMVDHSNNEPTFSGMIRGMSESGLAHARGNSGILFASYIKGLALEGKIFDVVTIKDFSCIAHHAVAYLYQAIENPIEGTMITVIKDWATFLFQKHDRYISFQELFIDAYQEAKASLQRTTFQLEILEKNHVVDSGAYGFVKFLNGINRFFSGAEIEDIAISIVDVQRNEDLLTDKYTFCTEAFIELSNWNSTKSHMELEKKIKSEISNYGDSLIVSSGGNKVRIHIHTDSPELVVDTLKGYGTFLEQKVDNMKLQKSVRTNRISNIGLLTDSIADLPEEFKLYNQIHTLSLGILLDESIYLDKLTLGLKQLFKAINESVTYPTSSQPEPGRVKAFLENLLEMYDSLIFITVAGKLSGTNQTINQELKNLELRGKKVTIIDSRLNSGAQGLLVKAAADMLQMGFSHDELVKEIESQIPKTNIYVCLNTLEYAIRSGRVPNTVGKIGMKLGMRPIMTLDQSGNGAAFGVAFSQKSITRQIYRLVKKAKKTTGIKAYSIVHADNSLLAMEYKNELTKIIGKEPEFVTEISSIVAIHSGPGCVAVSITRE